MYNLFPFAHLHWEASDPSLPSCSLPSPNTPTPIPAIPLPDGSGLYTPSLPLSPGDGVPCLPLHLHCLPLPAHHASNTWVCVFLPQQAPPGEPCHLPGTDLDGQTWPQTASDLELRPFPTLTRQDQDLLPLIMWRIRPPTSFFPFFCNMRAGKPLFCLSFLHLGFGYYEMTNTLPSTRNQQAWQPSLLFICNILLNPPLLHLSIPTFSFP